MSRPLRPSSQQLPGFTAEEESEWRGDFTFIQAADTQPGLQERYVERKSNPISWDWEIQLVKEAMLKVNGLVPRPRFLVVCGDLVDAMPGDVNRAAQVRDLFQAFSALNPDIPLVCLCGNHDVGDHPTPESIATYREDFGDDYFKFWVGGVKCLVLNSQLYEDASACAQLKADQDSWLEKELSAAENASARHILVFQHIPWFLSNINEAKTKHSIEPNQRRVMLDKFSESAVRTIFCGHYHRNAGGFYGNMELVVTSAIGVQLGSDDHGFRIVKVTEKEITHNYHALKDL